MEDTSSQVGSADLQREEGGHGSRQGRAKDEGDSFEDEGAEEVGQSSGHTEQVQGGSGGFQAEAFFIGDGAEADRHEEGEATTSNTSEATSSSTEGSLPHHTRWRLLQRLGKTKAKQQQRQ